MGVKGERTTEGIPVVLNAHSNAKRSSKVDICNFVPERIEEYARIEERICKNRVSYKTIMYIILVK